MNTLYISDLDGTLLNTETRLSEKTKNIINGLIEYGLSFTYATARSLASARVVTDGLSIKLPVITNNGTFIMDHNNGKQLDGCFFDRNQIVFLCDYFYQHKISPFVYSYYNQRERVAWIKGTENEGMQYYLNCRKGDERFCPVTSYDDLFLGDIFYFTCIGEKEELMPLYQEMQMQTTIQSIFQRELYRPEYWCEILNKQATKASAIQKLKTMLGYDRVVVFGDGINDISMFQIAEEAYAVENAAVELKHYATDVIDSNEQDGVAMFLQNRMKNRQ